MWCNQINWVMWISLSNTKRIDYTKHMHLTIKIDIETLRLVCKFTFCSFVNYEDCPRTD